MCLALSQPPDDLHSHLSRQHGSLCGEGGGVQRGEGRGRVVAMLPLCPPAAFLCVPGSETDTLAQEEVGVEEEETSQGEPGRGIQRKRWYI